jgi:hypothetical protein
MAVPVTDASSDIRTVRENHALEIEKEVILALRNWQLIAWRRDWYGTAVSRSHLMSESILEELSKRTTIVRGIDDFAKLTPPWTLATRYGEEVLGFINRARDVVYERYRLQQQLGDQLREHRAKEKAVEAERRAQRSLKNAEERKQLSYRKKREAKKRKRAEWVETYQRTGKRPCGKPPAIPLLRDTEY